MNSVIKYRSLGMKLTPQRLAILKFLEGNTTHPSAEEIFRSVQNLFPTMSLATVYSTLSALKEKGSILELTLDPDKKRYDPNTSMHNHFICMSCKTIIDIPGDQAAILSKSTAQQYNILKSQVEYFGICPDCKSKNEQ